MREIKFRAWDKRNRCFDYMPIILNGKVHILDSFDQLAETEQELQQYTGLKDRNGKEIYEGDIVNYDPDILPFASSRIGEVVYCEEAGAFGMVRDQRLDYYICDVEDLEVIGNIHQNPELLHKEAAADV